MISVTPVPLLAVRPRECILAPIVTGYAHIFVHGFSASAHGFSAVIFAFIKKSPFHLRKKNDPYRPIPVPVVRHNLPL